jgi:hypothetical protein
MTVFGAPAASPETPTPLPSAPDDTSAGTRSKAEELAKETQNPVAHLISVPFKWNMAFGVGLFNALQEHVKISSRSSRSPAQRIGAFSSGLIAFGKIRCWHFDDALVLQPRSNLMNEEGVWGATEQRTGCRQPLDRDDVSAVSCILYSLSDPGLTASVNSFGGIPSLGIGARMFSIPAPLKSITGSNIRVSKRTPEEHKRPQDNLARFRKSTW